MLNPLSQPVLLVSLDFELHWGVRDRVSPDSPYRTALLGARKAIPKLLELFTRHEIAATWASVGFLFAKDKKEFDQILPEPHLRPRYNNMALDPYREAVGNNEEDDPLHYARSLVEAIAATPRQEVGSHTFSHFYCQEAGADEVAFEADLVAAVAAARRVGVELKSFVFPRNQVNDAYLPILLQHGFTCYRGEEESFGSGDPTGLVGLARRAYRLLDSYWNLSGPNFFHLRPASHKEQLENFRASRFLRPAGRSKVLDRLQMRRLKQSLHEAALNRGVFHLWWHPHNFGVNTEVNLDYLAEFLGEFQELRKSTGMVSMTMRELAERG